MKQNRTKRLWAILLICTLMLGLSVPVLAASEENSAKEEVIYINLNSDGSVDAIYVVNTFELNESNQIVDYGDYTALRNMTTNDELVFEDQTIRIDTEEKLLYYEGQLSNTVIPWQFHIGYKLDDQTVTAEELAGADGSLGITLDVEKNPACTSSFFENYVLQITLLLGRERAENITAEDATRANVGGDVQLSYMVLPGKEKHFEITADVTDFEMDGISINGIHMDLAIDRDDITDTEALNEKVAEMQDGAKEMDEGVDDLLEGTGDLRDGADSLAKGTQKAADGAGGLSDGTNELSDGAKGLQSGAEALKEGTDDLIDGAENMQNGIYIVLDGAAELRSGTEALLDGAKELANGAKALQSGANSLHSGLAALTAQNKNLQSMSRTLYQQTLAQYGDILALAGYAVGEGTDLSALMTRRQNELSGDQQAAATENAIKARMTELQEEGNQDALTYWQLTLKLQNGDTLTDDEQAAYEVLTATVGESEQAIITERVTQILESTMLGGLTQDPVYQALAVLNYYQGVIAYTNGVSSAASGASSLASGAKTLASGAENLEKGAGDLYTGSDSMYNGLEDLLDGAVELENGCYALGDGTVSLLDGVIELQEGIVTLQDGVISLQDGIVVLCDGAIELYDGTVELYDGTVKLKDGTLELLDKTADMKDSILDGIVDAINDMFGADFLPSSFTDSRNKNVTLVQFVIQTPDIATHEAENEEVEEVQLSWWDKLKALF